MMTTLVLIMNMDDMFALQLCQNTVNNFYFLNDILFLVHIFQKTQLAPGNDVTTAGSTCDCDSLCCFVCDSFISGRV